LPALGLWLATESETPWTGRSETCSTPRQRIADLGSFGFTCRAPSYIVQWRILNVLALDLCQSSGGAPKLCA